MIRTAEQTDSLWSNFALPRQARFFPLGFPLDIETNSSAVLDAARSSWGQFTPRFPAAPVRLSLGVTAASGDGPPGIPTYRSRENLLSIISEPGNFIVCDLARGFGYGWLSPEAVSDSLFFRYYFLEAAVLTLLEQAHAAPVHAGFVQLDGCGVLLCGDTFAGKSTLAYACARRGWTFLSDDGVYLPHDRAGRFGIGNPHSLRLREDAPRLFPELAGRLAGIRANGKVAIEMRTSELDGITTATAAKIDHLVFLDRTGAADAVLQPAGSNLVTHWLESLASFGPAEVKKTKRETYQGLYQAGLWKLRYQDLDLAVARLERLAREGR